jgi:ribosome-associated protein
VAEPLRVSATLALPLDEIELRTSRSSGPGGQHAQKTETRVEAVFDVEASATLTDAQRALVRERLGPVVRAVAQDERSQARNRELALERLAETLAAALRPRRKRRPTRPSAAARERRLTEKRRRGEAKRLRRPPGDE